MSGQAPTWPVFFFFLFHKAGPGFTMLHPSGELESQQGNNNAHKLFETDSAAPP